MEAFSYPAIRTTFLLSCFLLPAASRYSRTFPMQTAYHPVTLTPYSWANQHPTTPTPYLGVLYNPDTFPSAILDLATPTHK